MRLSLVRRMLLSNLRRNEATSTSITPQQPQQAAGDRLRKIDLSKDWESLPQAQQLYIKKIIEKNNERYEKEKKLRTHYRISATVLFGIVFSIYFYSMYAVKQEKFLDDFDMPTPPDPAVKDFKR